MSSDMSKTATFGSIAQLVNYKMQVTESCKSHVTFFTTATFYSSRAMFLAYYMRSV